MSTTARIKPKEEPDTALEGDCTSNGYASGEDTMAECFQITSHLETELDEIITFDACPSTRLLITSHKSTLLRVWDLDKSEVIKTVKSLHNLPITLIEIHKMRVAGRLQKTLKSKGTPSPSRRNEDVDVTVVPTYDEAVSSSRADLVWATVAGATVKFWELGGNKMSKMIHIGNIASIGYATWQTGDNKRFFIAERNIYVLEATASGDEAQYKITQTLEGHYSQVTGIEFVQEGSMMISGGRDKVLILWTIDQKNVYTRVKTIPFPETIESLVLTSPSDLYVALNPSDIRHYDIQKNVISPSSVLKKGIDEPVVSLHPPLPSLDDSTRDYFVAATHSSVLFHLKPNKKKKLKFIKQYVGCLDEILCVTFWNSPNKVAVSTNTNVIKVYTLSSGQCELLRGHKDIVLSLDTQKDWLVSSSKDNSIMLWSEGLDKPQIILEGHLASVTGICFSSSDFLVYSVSEDNFLKLWDPKSVSVKCLKSQVAHDKEIHSVHCSPNGALVITCSRDKTAKIWDGQSLGLVGILKGHKKSVWDAKFSTWDQLAVTSSADTTIKIWNVISFNCIQTLQGHLSSVLQADFVNLGLQVCSTSSDGTMRIWDLKSSMCLATEECGNDKIWAMCAQPDLSVILTGSADSALTVWEDVTEEKVKESQAKRRRFLEDEQKLNNVMRSGQWEQAFRLALELDRPFTLLRIVRELKETFQELNSIIKGLTMDLKVQLVDYIRQWNSNTKTSTEAQYLLNSLLKTTSFQLLENHLPTDALIAYTEKHYNRLRTHRERVAVIQYFANKDLV